MHSAPLSMLLVRTGNGMRLANRSTTAAPACPTASAELDEIGVAHEVGGGALLSDQAAQAAERRCRSASGD
jgi:hypothetical protein